VLSATDADNDTLTYSVVVGPGHGALSGTPPSLTYTPAGGYTGPDSFTFKANDTKADSNIATVSITVNEGTTPLLPSSFYGEIHFSDLPPGPGDQLDAFLPGNAAAVATTAIQMTGSTLTYTLNVPAGSKGASAEGDTITFVLEGRVVATHAWHVGTNVHLDFHPPQALPGGPYEGDRNTVIAFSGSANDWGSDVSTYQWDWDNDGTYDTTGRTPSHTWTSAGTYTVGLKVTDLQGGEGTATVQVKVNLGYVTHSWPLVAGWNLVSFDLHPLDTDIADVLASLAGNYDLVYAWDASGAHSSDGNWLKYTPTVSYDDTLLSLDETLGFWIRLTTADVLDVTGTIPTSTNIVLSTTAGGWNLVGFPSATSGSLPAIVQGHGVGTDYTLLYAYHANDPETPPDYWKLFDRTGATFANDLTALDDGWGYWIKVTATHTWNVVYAP
jgi:hypothetical protein